MRFSVFLPLGALCASTVTLASPYVVHEKRHVSTDDQWSKLTQLDSNAVLPIRIGLKQQNLELGDQWLMEVSDPTSPKFGKHWTSKEVADAFKPRCVVHCNDIMSSEPDKRSHETIKEVHDWLHEAGIHNHRHQLSDGLNWLQFNVRLS